MKALFANQAFFLSFLAYAGGDAIGCDGMGFSGSGITVRAFVRSFGWRQVVAPAGLEDG